MSHPQSYDTYVEFATNCLKSAADPNHRDRRDYYTARAQVYATLALAAATAHGTQLDPAVEDRDMAGNVQYYARMDSVLPGEEGY